MILADEDALSFATGFDFLASIVGPILDLGEPLSLRLQPLHLMGIYFSLFSLGLELRIINNKHDAGRGHIKFGKNSDACLTKCICKIIEELCR